MNFSPTVLCQAQKGPASVWNRYGVLCLGRWRPKNLSGYPARWLRQMPSGRASQPRRLSAFSTYAITSASVRTKSAICPFIASYASGGELRAGDPVARPPAVEAEEREGYLSRLSAPLGRSDWLKRRAVTGSLSLLLL